MSLQTIIDSHIHLWPKETANEDGHAWMTPGNPLAKPHLLSDYCKVSDSRNSDGEVEGVVYVETDVRYDTPSGDVETWAKGPLDEIGFLRRIVAGEYGDRDSMMLLAAVPWAPMDQPPSTLDDYLRLAEERAGTATWSRIKGFRFLLQFIYDQSDFQKLVLGDDLINNLKTLGRRGFSFDVGVDQRSGGTWQLELVIQAMKLAHQGVQEEEKVIFIINHLCKPEFATQGEEFDRWCKAVTAMSELPKTYMKLSGAFSELPSGLKDMRTIAAHMKPWLTHVFQTFGAKRVMFGSDWPVCNVNGPLGEESWLTWRDVVKDILKDDSYALSQPDRDAIWHGTCKEAYRIDLG